MKAKAKTLRERIVAMPEGTVKGRMSRLYDLLDLTVAALECNRPDIADHHLAWLEIQARATKRNVEGEWQELTQEAK